MAVRQFEGKALAEAYLQFRVAPKELIGIIMSFMEKRTRQFHLAVDVGCGSGQGTTLLAPFFTQVVGTDISPAQLEMAAKDTGPSNVSYRQCPAEDLPFECEEVDLVTAMTSAHWFDRNRFLHEADRVLRPGGCLALVSYTMDMELEFGNVSRVLNDICREFYTSLLPYRNPHIGSSSMKIYEEMFHLCPYPDKEWNECHPIRWNVPLSGFIGMVETFSSYQNLKEQDPAEAHRQSLNFQHKLLSAMRVSSPDTEVFMIVKYFYCLAQKP